MMAHYFPPVAEILPPDLTPPASTPCHRYNIQVKQHGEPIFTLTTANVSGDSTFND
jgi:hypothetical protein